LAAGVGVGEGLDAALVEQPAERLLGADMAQVVEHLVPEAGVQQVQHRVLDAQVVRAGRVLAQPVLLHLAVDESLGVAGVQAAQVVPAGAGPLRHRVGLATVVLDPVPPLELDVAPVLIARQRRLGLAARVVGVVGGGGVVVDLGQLDGQLVVGQRDRHAVGVPDDRQRLAPVALAGEQPVAQLVLGERLAVAAGHQPIDDRALGLVDAQPVQVDLGVGGVDGRAVAGEGLALPGTGVDGPDDRQAERRREVPVALVLAGNGHDRAGAVAHQNVVGGEDRSARR
jgi:hypothetical protein